MFRNLLIYFGLEIDPKDIAGRPDRFVPSNGIELDVIRWGSGHRYGTEVKGDFFGEWEISLPPQIENDDDTPLPYPTTEGVKPPI